MNCFLFMSCHSLYHQRRLTGSLHGEGTGSHLHRHQGPIRGRHGRPIRDRHLGPIRDSNLGPIRDSSAHDDAADVGVAKKPSPANNFNCSNYFLMCIKMIKSMRFPMALI